MIRTLIFGAIAGYVGKKLYDEGKLTEFKNDLSTRFNEAKVKLDEQRAQNGVTTDTTPMVSPTTSTARPLPN
ncbi:MULTISPECIES: hypothetical protein [Sphingobium]|uniref:Uncharacterized protein n=1 Tax=Sphingobium lactosutens DS20 TaxID=1331060 RepID=T0HH72_9SPHN|nr:hypothetical protein [Sphingobium lactosutens]EQB12347.1 hypothetical protein RLDS_19565 [Sphingobium lactosutens DS20]